MFKQRKQLVLLIVFSLLLMPATTSAQSQSGFYLGMDLGGAQGMELATDLGGVNHPTRCDVLLYPDPSDAPNDAACTNNTPGTILTNSFAGSLGFTGAFSAGYEWAGTGLRLEGEFLQRSGWGGTKLIAISGGNDALRSKDAEWSTDDLPTETLSNFSTRQIFANVYYGFLQEKKLKPFVGLGAGLAQTKARYSNRFVRKTDLPGDEVWHQAAEGTVSVLSADMNVQTLGLQAIVGAEYSLSERVSFMTKARWAHSREVSQGDFVWTLIRSHRPVQADGRTPFGATITFDPASAMVLTFGLRYHN